MSPLIPFGMWGTNYRIWSQGLHRSPGPSIPSMAQCAYSPTLWKSHSSRTTLSRIKQSMVAPGDLVFFHYELHRALMGGTMSSPWAYPPPTQDLPLHGSQTHRKPSISPGEDIAVAVAELLCPCGHGTIIAQRAISVYGPGQRDNSIQYCYPISVFLTYPSQPRPARYLAHHTPCHQT